MSDALTLSASQARRKRPWHWREKLILTRIISNTGYVVYFIVALTIGDVGVFGKTLFLLGSALLVYVTKEMIPLLVQSRQNDGTLPARMYAIAQPRFMVGLAQILLALMFVTGFTRNSSAIDFPFAAFLTGYGILEYYFWWKYRER